MVLNAARLANAGVPVQMGNNTAPVLQKANGVNYQNAGFINSSEFINGTKIADSIDGSTQIPMVTQDDIHIMRSMSRSAASSQHFGTWGGRSRSRGVSSAPYLDQIPQSKQNMPFGGSLPEGGLPTDIISPYHLPLTPLNNLRLEFLGMNVKGGLTPGMSGSEFDASTFHGLFMTSSSGQGNHMATFPRVRSQTDGLSLGKLYLLYKMIFVSA
ncbi:hypothetical protein J437_LFUL007717 [Ladona fulva]|uniref:Uncharacterized protein n=1 Tax=Ladona fulva TaxID=123851 RepID=A0A8K0K144_LADFU|nr:hypothetical protein J437_LFUL007717 [Ladona fulva]